MPKCCVRPIAVSGANVKLPRLRPSMSALLRFDSFNNRAKAWATNQCALRIEYRTYGTVMGATSTTSR